MANKPMTVSDVAELIRCREELRAELHALALRAYDHWCELEARLDALEARLDQAVEPGGIPRTEPSSGTIRIRAPYRGSEAPRAPEREENQ